MTLTVKVVDELCKLDLLTLDKGANNISTFVKAQTRKAKAAAKAAAKAEERRELDEMKLALNKTKVKFKAKEFHSSPEKKKDRLRDKMRDEYEEWFGKDKPLSGTKDINLWKKWNDSTYQAYAGYMYKSEEEGSDDDDDDVV